MSVEATVRFWAGARRAAGRAEEPIKAGTLGEVKAQLRVRPELEPICRVASFLVDGERGDDGTTLRDGSVVDVLPPFAGG